MSAAKSVSRTYSDVAEYLNQFFKKRRQRNPRYSLRALARDAEISVGRVSEILSGKYLPGKIAKERIAEALKLSAREREQLDFIIGNHLLSRKDPRSKHFLTEADLVLLPEWRHFAVLNLMQTADFKSDVAWIANRLELSVRDTEDSIQKLLNAGLIKSENGALSPTHMHLTSTHDVPSAALRNYNRQLIERSLWSLDHDSVDVRDITSIIIPANPAKLYQLKLLAKDFRAKACDLLSEGELTEVYNVCIQIVPTTKIRKQKDPS